MNLPGDSSRFPAGKDGCSDGAPGKDFPGSFEEEGMEAVLDLSAVFRRKLYFLTKKRLI